MFLNALNSDGSIIIIITTVNDGARYKRTVSKMLAFMCLLAVGKRSVVCNATTVGARSGSSNNSHLIVFILSCNSYPPGWIRQLRGS